MPGGLIGSGILSAANVGGVGFAPTDLDGLIALYEPYRVASGSSSQTLQDRSGNGNDGQLGSTSNSDTNDPSFDGDGLDFDGSDDYVVISNSSSLVTGSQNRTVFVVGKVPANEDGGMVLIGDGGGANGRRWAFRFDVGTLRIEVQGAAFSSSLSPSADTFFFAACVLDGSQIGDHTIYLDGSSEEGSGSTPIDTADDITRLGMYKPSGTTHYSGLLSAVGIYNVALGQSEINQLRDYYRSEGLAIP